MPPYATLSRHRLSFRVLHNPSNLQHDRIEQRHMSGEGIARSDRFGRTSYPFYFSDGVDINGITGESMFDYIQRVEKANNGIVMEAMIGHWERRLKR